MVLQAPAMSGAPPAADAAAASTPAPSAPSSSSSAAPEPAASSSLGPITLLRSAVATEGEAFAPRIARTTPWTVSVTAGRTYAWCGCGYSKRQPWCDKTCFRRLTPTAPVEFVANQTTTIKLCGCKHSTTAPLCSGQHKAVRLQLWRKWGVRAAMLGASFAAVVSVVRLADQFAQRSYDKEVERQQSAAPARPQAHVQAAVPNASGSVSAAASVAAAAKKQ